MNRSTQGPGRTGDKAFLLVTTFVLFIVVILTAEQVVSARQLRTFYQQSPLPTSTWTPTPPSSTPTDTPAPPTPTDTPVPPTPTDTPVPPTATPAPNSPPVIDAITGPADPVNINDQPVTVVVDFSDPDVGDTHNVIWNWGDGSATDTQAGAVSPAAQGHTYAEPGVYAVLVTVADSAGNSDSETYEFIVIYDPAGGYVTGKGFFDSPPGAYTPDNPDDPDLTGEARFGFISEYRAGASVPTGNTYFQFRTARLHFFSDTYHWLIVNQNDHNAQFRGEGIIKGDDRVYQFMIWASDDDPDSFRIKVWLETPAGELRLYDNGSKAPLTDGSITIYDGR